MTVPTVYKSIELASGGRVSLTVQMDWLKADAAEVQFCRLLAGALDDYEKEATKRAARDTPPAPQLPPVATFEATGFVLADCPVEGCEWAGTLDGLRQHLASRPHRLTGAAKRVKARRAELIALAAKRHEDPALPQVPLWPEAPPEPGRVVVVQAQARQADGERHACPYCPSDFQSGAGLGGHISKRHGGHDQAVADARKPEPDAPPVAESEPLSSTEMAHMDEAAVMDAALARAAAPLPMAAEPAMSGRLSCIVTGPDGRGCGFDADDAEQMDRHLRRRHQLYEGDAPDDVEFRADAVREAQAAAGLPAEWGL